MAEALQTSFRPGPSYRGADAKETFAKALDLPLSVTSTLGDQALDGLLQSYGAGTAIRDFTVPEGKSEGRLPPIMPEEEGAAPDAASDDFFSMNTLKSAADFLKGAASDDFFSMNTLKSAADFLKGAAPFGAYDQARQLAQYFINDPSSPALDEEAYKKSKYFRDDVPWDPSMTEDRAAALAMGYDARKVREFYAEKRPWTSLAGQFVGQAGDPLNYIPIAGPAIRAAALAKLGKVGGTAAFSAVDAAANTAIFGLATRGQRAKYGDDVSWQMLTSEIAMAAVIGGAFGTLGGVWGARRDAKSRLSVEQRLSTLQRTQEARVALNEGIDALANDIDVALSPNATEAVRRVAADVRAARPLSEVGVTMRERLVAAGRDEVEATASARIIDDAYTTFADRSGMTVKELSDTIGLPVIRNAGEASGSGRLYQGGVREIKTLYHYTGAPEGTRLEPRTPAVPDGASPQAEAVYFATSAEDAYSYRTRASASGKPRMEQVPVDTTGFKNITAEIKKIRRRAGVESFGQAKAIAQQEAIAAGAPGTVFDGDGLNAGEVAVFDASRLYAEPNRTLFQSATVRRGDETLSKYGLEPGGRYNTREVAAALEARQRSKYGTIERGDYSPKASKRIASWMTDEVMFEVEQAAKNPAKSAVGWYSTKFQTALDELGAAFPEFRGELDANLPGVAILKTQKNARDFFTSLMAITSDGAKVADNFRFATDAYETFRTTGKIDDNVTFGGERNSSMRINLRNIQKVLDAQGPDRMAAFLLKKDTVSNLKKIAKAQGEDFSVAYKADMELPYSAIVFGPKLGAFYANLMGDTGYLTMDRWWSRTFNRYRGTLLTSPTDAGVARFKGLVAADRGIDASITDDEAIAATVDYVKSYKAKGFKNGTEIEKAANTLYKAAFEGLEDEPFNASDREFMIDTTMRAQAKLKKEGVNLTVADIQAVLWYYEKRLYGELGARQTQDISYEEIARNVAARRDPSGRSADEVDGAAEGEGTLDVGSAGEGRDVATDAVDEPFGGESVSTTPDVYKGRGGTIPINAAGRLEIRHFSHRQLDEIDPEARGTGPLFGGERDRLGPRPTAEKIARGEVDPNVVDRSYFGTGTPPNAADIDALFADRRAAKKLPVRKYDKNSGFTYPRHEAERAAFFKHVHQRGYAPEAGLGEFEHIADVDPATIYNVREDPLNLREKTDKELAKPEQDTQFERLAKDAGFKGLYYSWTELGQTVIMFEKVKPTAVKSHRTGMNLTYDVTDPKTVKLEPRDTQPLPGLTTGRPVPTVVQAARAYAAARGLPVRRQAEYVKADPERGARIAAAYDKMKHAPNNPKVKAAYQAMADETLAQYQFVKATGLKVEAIEPGQADPYPEGPKQVLDDLAKGHLWFYPTDQGFGSSDFDPKGNPLLAPTDEFVDGRRLVVNDVFRIVHDYFGHGIEGSGFGARGEENAWQSHMRLYSSDALPAVTSETRGQNSWVNFGPYGEANRANQKATVYADQKTGIMPEWTWREGVADDAASAAAAYNQDARGSIEFSGNGQSAITLFEKADASTVIHESGHFFLNMLRTLAEREGAPSTLKDDWMQVRVWWESNADAIAADIDGATPEGVRAYIAYGSAGDSDMDAAIDTGLHEQWARAFESYLRNGIAPTENLKTVFQQFKDWLSKIYTQATDLNVRMTPEITGVFDRMLGSDGKTVDATPPRPEPVPGGRAEAEANLSKTEDYKALASQHRVDPETGAFDEEPDIAQLEAEGRLTAEDAAVLADSKNAYDDGAAYGEALKAAVGCLV